MRIRRLDPTLANQIAAGEVVERPASVLKELLENSVDADARRIEVEIERGGTKLVRVRDDGVGIHRDDLMLALNRHATSKIQVFEDLRQIETLGFRGEALPSIASVSRLSLVSRVEGEESAWMVESAGSAEVSDPAPAAHVTGTTVEVRDLFFNTPARRKFLRTEKTEYRHLETMVKILALGHPGLEVVLVHNARPVFRLRAASNEHERDARVARLCGRRFVEHSLRVEFGAGGLELRGWVGGPGFDSRAAAIAHLFVNSRAVRDPVVRHAIRAACADWLGVDRQPAYVLDLVLPAVDVDVNVHPTKHEVRFRDSRLVHDFVVRCLRELGGESLLPTDTPGATAHPRVPFPRPGGDTRPRGFEVAESHGPYARSRHPRMAERPEARVAGTAEHEGAVLGPLNGRYAAVAAGAGIRLVDVVAARKQSLIAQLETSAAQGPVPSRPFLVPEPQFVAAADADRFETHETLLLRLGFEHRRVGPERITLREAPIALAGTAPAKVTSALAAALRALGDEAEEDRVSVLIRHFVEHLDVPVDWPRVGALLEELQVLSAEPGSASGRVWVEVSGEDIAALFDATERG